VSTLSSAAKATNQMPRILIFSPYALWSIHTIYEETIAKACAAQGAEVRYLLCDGLLPECDQHWDSKSSAGRPADICQRCKIAAVSNMNRLSFPYGWLGGCVSQLERAEAFAWAQQLSPSEFREATYHGLPLGTWVLSSVVSYFRKYPPSLDNWRVVSVYRGFLYSAALVATGLGNYLDANQVDAALLFNGRQSITRVAFELFRARGIRVLTHERAEYERGHINVKPNAHCMSPEPFKGFWRDRTHVPLDRKALDATLRWLIRRRYGANLAWIPFNSTSRRHLALRKQMNPGSRKRLWVLFTSSMDETAADPVMQGPYESQTEWVRDVVKWVGSRNDIQLVIKVHPNLGGNSYIGKAVDELSVYTEMKPTLPANVRIIMPEDQVSAYELAEEADLGLTFGSIMGLEMAMLGKPVVLASRALYENASRILTVRSKEALTEVLELGLGASADREMQREAFRLAYAYVFLFELPFPTLKVLGLYEAKVNYTDVSELLADATLQNICGFLIHGENLHPAPCSQEQSRTTADEDSFFAKLVDSPDYLRSRRYERWLMMRSLGRATRDALHRLPFGAGRKLTELGRGRWNTLLTRVERKAMENGG
jgi:hypothetical protein